MNLKELVVSFKEKLIYLKDKLTREVEKLENKAKMVGQLRNIFGSRTSNLYELFLEIPSDEIMEYVQYANISFTIEDINKFKYILSEDIFNGTYRYKEARDSFEALANQLRVESLKRIPTEQLEDYKKRCSLIEELVAKIKEGKITGPIDNIGEVMELFESVPLNEFTDEEKEEIIKQLLISDLGYLNKASEELENRAIRRQENAINESEEVVIVDEELDTVRDEEIVPSSNEETLDTGSTTESPSVEIEKVPPTPVPPKEEKVPPTPVPPKEDKTTVEVETNPREKEIVAQNVGPYRSVISLDKVNLLNSIGLYADKAIGKYAPKTHTHEEHLMDLAERLGNKEFDLEILRSILVIDRQFAYVLAVYIRNKVVQLNDFLDTVDEIEEDVISELFEDQMHPITEVYELLKKMIEKISLEYADTETVQQSEMEEDDKFKIVFVKNGLESYFSKSLLELRSYENIGNIEKILVELENGMFSGDRKVQDFKYKNKGSFAIFYKVKNGHIFIFNVILSRDLASKKTDNMLSIISYDDELEAVLEKGPEYRKLMEDSNKEREELRVMLGVAMNNEPQV